MPLVRDVRKRKRSRIMWRKTKRIKDVEGRGRREWVRENGVRWDSWDALVSKMWGTLAV